MIFFIYSIIGPVMIFGLMVVHAKKPASFAFQMWKCPGFLLNIHIAQR